jgi:hypothetical protein
VIRPPAPIGQGIFGKYYINYFFVENNEIAGNTSYTIIPELKLIITYCNGRVLMEDIIQLNRNFISDQRYDPSFDLLMDFRESIAIAFKFDILDFSISLKKMFP